MYVNQPGPSGNMPASRRLKTPTRFIAATSPRQKGLSVAFVLPPIAAMIQIIACHRDVGMAGVAIDSIYDMRTLFSGIPLDQMSVSMTMNGAVLPILGCFVAAAEEQACRGKTFGTIQNDILKEFMVATPTSIRRALDADHLRHLCLHLAKNAEIQLDLHLRLSHAGGRRDPGPRSSPIRWLTASNISVPGSRPDSMSTALHGLSFFWAIGMNFFMEVAKMRAARLLWAKLLTQLTRRTALAQSAHALPDLGLVADRAGCLQHVMRTTIEAMAATQGHTQSLHTNALDEALALPTDFLRSNRAQHAIVLQQESGTNRIIDPWGGSYYVERLTHDLAVKAWGHIGRSRRSVAWRKRSRPACQIADRGGLGQTQARIDAGQQAVIGVKQVQADKRSTIDV